MTAVLKRDGRTEYFDKTKVYNAVSMAAKRTSCRRNAHEVVL